MASIGREGIIGAVRVWPRSAERRDHRSCESVASIGREGIIGAVRVWPRSAEKGSFPAVSSVQ